MFVAWSNRAGFATDCLSSGAMKMCDIWQFSLAITDVSDLCRRITNAVKQHFLAAADQALRYICCGVKNSTRTYLGDDRQNDHTMKFLHDATIFVHFESQSCWFLKHLLNNFSAASLHINLNALNA